MSCSLFIVEVEEKSKSDGGAHLLVSEVLLSFGTQFIAYPFVFFYLLAAGSSTYRQKIEQRWRSDVSK
ncbi:hypothetical protein [Enterococcus spodopteracolus]|uniref:hypothetical protein n=1 Tax=Enterococcus spodopteracolus TaxID=3034501 RepID=UPI0026493733|nr:hypothetical protein [Enterococcus spodopteracolus]